MEVEDFPGGRGIVGSLDLSAVSGRVRVLLDRALEIDIHGLDPEETACMNRMAETVNAALAARAEEGRLGLARHGLLPMLEAIAATRPDAAFKPDYADLFFLYAQVRRCRPGVVWEFGSGWSTYVLARAMKENGAGRIFSMECDAGWTDVTRRGLPNDLADCCEILHSPSVPADEYPRPGLRHAALPAEPPDFVYLDGPILTEARKVAVDVLDVEGDLLDDCLVVVDGRLANVLFLAENLKGRWKTTCEAIRLVGEGGGVVQELALASMFEKG